MSKPAVLVISMGGTIAMVSGHDQGVTPQLAAEQIVEAIPELRIHWEVTARSFRCVPGADLTLDDIRALAEEIRRLLHEDAYAGVVVTQGTDTIAETSFALDLLIDSDTPIVVTGAMRHAAEPGGDGPANLRDAVSVAAGRAARGLGTLVVLNGEVHAARFVGKHHTVRPGAFVSLPGPLGWVSERQPHIVLRLAQRMVHDIKRIKDVGSRIALLTTAFGEDGTLIGAVRDRSYDGLVIEALGAGHVPRDQVDLLAQLAKAIPVVLCSRAAGPILTATYGFAGSESDLLGRGLINGGYLGGPKARILLQLLLEGRATREGVAKVFQAFADDGTGA